MFESKHIDLRTTSNVVVQSLFRYPSTDQNLPSPLQPGSTRRKLHFLLAGPRYGDVVVRVSPYLNPLTVPGPFPHKFSVLRIPHL